MQKRPFCLDCRLRRKPALGPRSILGFHPEKSNRLLQLRGLRGQLLIGGSHLPDGSAVHLNSLIKLLESPGVFIDAPGLFIAGRINSMNQFRSFLYLRHDFVDFPCVERNEKQL